MSDYLPDEFGDLGDYQPEPLPDNYSFEGRYAFGDGSVIVDVYLDFSRESFIREEELQQLRDMVSLPQFEDDSWVDQHYRDPTTINWGEVWTTGPFDSPQEAVDWMLERGVIAFSGWYRDSGGDVWVAINRNTDPERGR